MATWYSDHFGADGDNDTSLASPATVVSAGVSHGRIRYKRATMTGMPVLTATADTVRMLTLRSSDRLFELLISSDGGSTAGAVNVGLYLRGTNHDGAVMDADLFMSAQAISTAIDRTDAFVESTSLAGTDRGKQMWELYAITDGTDTVDPDLDYDVVMAVSTDFSVADSVVTLEAYYTSGD